MLASQHNSVLSGAGLRRAFSPADAKDAGLIVEQRRKPGGSGYYYILRNQHYEDGYLVKQYGRARLELISGLPPLEELQRFNQVRQIAPTCNPLVSVAS